MTKPDVEAFLAFVSAAAHAAQFSYEHEGDPVKLKAWLAEELKQFSDDEGVDALKAKFDKWIAAFEDLAELRIPYLSMTFAMIKELHRMCSFNGALNEVRYVDMTEAEFEAWKLEGPCTKLGASEAGFTLQRGSEFVGWFADDNQYRRILSR